MERAIEQTILSWNGNGRRPTRTGMGKISQIDDAVGRHVVFAKSTFPKQLSLDGMKVVIDCANGAAYRAAPTVFEELGAEVESIGVTPNGHNRNEACGSLHPRLKSKGRILDRYSGTQPLCRVMAEGEDLNDVAWVVQVVSEAIRLHA